MPCLVLNENAAYPRCRSGIEVYNVFFPEIAKDFVKTAIYEYEKLRPGNVIEGPAIIESSTSTVVIPPEKVGRINSYLQIVLEL